MRARTFRRWFLSQSIAILALILSAMVSSVWAQSAVSASIQGTVTDASKGVLPGVTVTVTSPALQVPQVVVTTDTAGSYRIVDLPVGVYRVSYELPGFQQVVRDELRLTVGFTARVDVTLKVGDFEESVNVSGQSPVVDVAPSAVATSNFTTELLESIPRGRGLWEVLPMASGVQKAGAPDVGDSRLANRGNLITYGVSAQPNLLIEGLHTQHSSEHSSAVFLDGGIFVEVSVKAAGNSADLPLPGLGMRAVVRSGGNEFHGKYSSAFETPGMQASNLNDELRAQNLRQAEPLRHYWDATSDLGGRIVRNRLWFYGAVSKQEIVQGLIGFTKSPGPDGVWLTEDDEPADRLSSLGTYAGKVSYQPSRSHKFNWVLLWGNKTQPEFQSSRTRPLETTIDLLGTSRVHKGEYQATLRDNLLLTAVGGEAGFTSFFRQQGRVYPVVDVAGNPSRIDILTNFSTGPAAQAPRERPFFRKSATTTLNYYPSGSFLGGRHEVKIGNDLTWEDAQTRIGSTANGDYILRYSGPRPIEIQIFNYPVSPTNRMNTIAVYLIDSWRRNRLTVDAGLRWERYHAFLPPQAKEAGPFSAAGTFPKLDALTWNHVVPRLALAWDLRGTGKTVLKSTFGEYGHSMGSDYAQIYNPNAEISTTYRWTDPNGNGDYNPGEVNLDRNGPAFIRTSGASSQIPAPDLRQPVTRELTAGVQHELVANTAVSVTYVYKSQRDLYARANMLRPHGVHTVPIERRDPGPDGVSGTADDGGFVTIWDYPASFRGAAFVGNKDVNSPNISTYQSVDLSLDRRFSRSVNVRSSFWVTKNHAWLTTIAATPNEDYFPLDETWSWQSNTHGTFAFPRDLQLAATLRVQSGVPGQRTATFRSIPSQSTVTLRMEPFGAQRSSARVLADVRVGKQFGRHVSITWQLFNAFNNSASTSTTYLSGPTFGHTTAIVGARTMRLGGEVRF